MSGTLPLVKCVNHRKSFGRVQILKFCAQAATAINAVQIDTQNLPDTEIDHLVTPAHQFEVWDAQNARIGKCTAIE